MRKKKLLQNLYLKLKNTTNIFYQAIEIVVNCKRFQQKDLIGNLQTMELLLLKALREEDFGHELQQMSPLFSSDLHKFKLETQLKNLTHIVDEKQVGIKYAITIISSLNPCEKLLVSEVLELVNLILTIPTSNAVSLRSCATLCRFKTYLRSSMIQELLSYCLILATYKDKVDKLKFVEAAKQFCFENKHHFSI